MADDPNWPWTARPPYLKRWIDKRTGRERVYLRKGSGAKIALKAAWGTQALADEAAAALGRIKVRPPAAIGTLVGAVRAYRGDRERGIPASADYLTLTARTQVEYDRWLDRFEIIFEGVLLEDVDAGYVLELRDRWAERGYRAANLALQILKNVCKAPIIRGEIAGDPFARIEKVQRPHDLGESNPRWEDGEVQALLEWALARKRPGLARAVALGRWGGFRKQTVCRVPLRARIVRDVEDGGTERRLLWVTEKKLVLCDRREDLRLTQLLADTEKAAGRVTALTVAYNSLGQPWKPRALSHAIDRAIAALAKQGKLRPNLTFHGLRHSRGVELAAAGASDAEIMAQLDHATSRAAAIYRRQAERLRLADAAQDRVDAQIIRLKANTKRKGNAG